MTFFETLALFGQHLRYLCQKELITIFKDPRMQFMLVMPVIIQGFIFGYAANYNLDRVPYAVVDESHSSSSRDYLARFSGTTSFELKAVLGNTSELGDLITSGDVIIAIVIPQDFEDVLSRGGTAPVQVIADGRNSSIAGIATGYVSQITAAWNESRRGSAGPITIESRTWYNPNQITRWNFLPGLIAMISFVQVIFLAGLSIAREREQDTFEQLLVTPLSPLEILIGKAMPPMLIGFAQSAMLYLIARYWFAVPFAGSLGTLTVIILVFMLSSTGIGLSISAVSRNMQQVLVYVLVLMIPMVLLSGIATPVRNMPEFLQIITYADPMRFAVDAVKRVYLEGAGLAAIWRDLVPMFLIAAVTMPIAAWLFRHRTV